MERDRMEQLFQLIGEERCNKILKAMSHEASVDGFRKGKVPVRILQGMIKTSGIPQQHFFRLVVKEYFPEVDPTTVDLDSLSVAEDTEPGLIAAYALRGREQQIVWPQDTALTNDDTRNTPEPSGNDNRENNDKESEHTIEHHFTDIRSSDSPSMYNTVETIDKPETAEERQETHLSTQYLGYIQVVTNNYNNTFYNFHPIAVLNDVQHLFVLDTEEIAALFPEKGNINIYARYRNDVRLEDQFGNGVCLSTRNVSKRALKM